VNSRNYFITRNHQSASAQGRTLAALEAAIDLQARIHNLGISQPRSESVYQKRRSALKRGGYGTEASMTIFRLLGLAAILSAAMATPVLAQAIVQEPRAYASNETTIMPWSAPIGHRQPRAVDVPASTSASQQIIDQEDANVDRKVKGVCRGC
jgi:hypothetical protein